MVDQARGGPWTHGLGPRVFFRKNNPSENIFQPFFSLRPLIFPLSTCSPSPLWKFTPRPLEFEKIIPEMSLASEKSTKIAQTSKFHIFSTTTPNLVILVP
jgi:hypothetical protein